MSTKATASPRIARPDREELNRKVGDLNKKLNDLRSKESKVREQIDANKVLRNSDPEWTKLLGLLNVAKEERSKIQETISTVQTQIKQLESDMQRKIKEIQDVRNTKGFKSISELEAAIKRLEGQVESGELSLVAEKKLVKEITSLKNARRYIATTDKTQEEIKVIKSKIGELRKVIDDSGIKPVNTKINEIKAKLDSRKSELDSLNKKVDDFWTQRREIRAEIKRFQDERAKLYNEFNDKMNKFHDTLRAQKAEREAEEKAAKAAAAKAHKVEAAKEKLEAAKQPAYATDIARAEALLSHLDPSYKPGDASQKKEEAQKNNLDVVRESRVVEGIPENAKILSKPKHVQAESAKKTKGGKTSGKSGYSFELDLSVINGLSYLNINLPTSVDAVPETVAAIKEKIAFFKENNDRETAARVKVAEEELAKIEALDASEFVVETDAEKDKEKEKEKAKEKAKDKDNSAKKNSDHGAKPKPKSKA